jgi:3-hydroxy-9,10-secoandrosta-1,3,5(10)-triene-9,17-dione monooxygenase
MATVAQSGERVGIPTREQLLDRARKLAPVLKERAAEAEAARNLQAETIQDFQEAGFFRVLQPRRWGGYEMEPSDFFDIQMALAEGDMSAAWVYGVVGCHPYELALFHDQAQADVWGEDDSVLVSSSYQPVGKVERIDGGFRLSGRWGFSSGSLHCQWVLLGALIPPAAEGQPPEMRTFLVPRTDYVIEDTWDVFGLKATGSNDIVVDGAFVPDYRTHKATDGFLCANPGQLENDGPLYRLPWAQVFTRSVSTAALGATRGALSAFIEIAKSRVSTNTGKASKADPLAMAAAAKAAAQVDEMVTTLHRNFATLLGYAQLAEPMPADLRLFYRYQSTTVVRRCADLVNEMMPLLGGRAIYNHSPIVRYWLDLNAGRAHVANDPSFAAPDLFMNLMGEEPTPGFY